MLYRRPAAVSTRIRSWRFQMDGAGLNPATEEGTLGLPVASIVPENVFGDAVGHAHCRARALHILEAAGDIRRVPRWLGHQSLQTTEMCLRADPAEKLGTISEWRSPGLGKGRLAGVRDDLMAMLANV